MDTYPNLVSVLNMTFDKFSSDCSVNYSRFTKLYGTTCNSVLAKNQPHCLRRANKPLRRASEPLRRSNQSLRRSCQSLRRSNQSLWISNQSPERTQNNPQEKNGYQPSTKPAVSHNQSIHFKMSHYKRARHSIGTCINSDDCAHQCRLSGRQLTKQPHVKQIRDREPSRLPLKRIVLALRKRKNRSFLKHYVLNSAPKSSFLNMVASDYKLCCFQFVL